MSSYSDTWKNVLTNPTLFFENMPKSGGYTGPLMFATISYIAGSFVIFVLLFLIEGTASIVTSLKSSAGFGILIIIAGVAGLFISSFIFFISFKILGGKGNFEGTFRQVSYSSAPAVFLIFPILLLYSLYLMTIGGEYVHNIGKARSAVAVFLPAAIIGGILFLFVVAPFTYSDFPEPPPPAASIKVLSATATSIELRHYGGDVLNLSEMRFTVEKADGEVLKPYVSSVNSSYRFSVGDTIKLHSASFGNSGDSIKIVAECKNVYSNRPMVEILNVRTRIK